MMQHEGSKQSATQGNAELSDAMKRDEVEHARIGYQAAISLWIHEGSLIWSKFNALLVANSIIIASIGLTLSASNQNAALVEIFLKWMPIVGIVLCILWMLLTRRSFEAHDYWVLSARELEEQFLKPTVRTVSRGGAFAAGERIELTIDDRARQLQKKPVRQLSVEWISYITIVLFFALYVIIGASYW